MTSNEKLIEEANDVIRRLFADKSVSPQQTKENLEMLVEEIEILIDALDHQ